MSATDHLNPVQFYHGTSRSLTGNVIEPRGSTGQESNYGTMDSDRAEYAYATRNLGDAGTYASNSTGPHERVYRVEPLGKYDADPNDPDAVRSKQGFRVTGVVPEEKWVNEMPDEMEAFGI